ncbi:MAG: hypothetical protein MI920_08820, partial [Kiloniellales bacterium]|nr:hypothetical protein [Kiloniellales bacterium]
MTSPGAAKRPAETGGPQSRPLVKAAGLVAAPGLVVLLILIVLGQLDWRYGLGGAAVLVICVALLVHSHLDKIARLRQRIEALGRGDLEAAEGQEAPSSLSPGLDEAIAETARERRASRIELESVLAGNEAILENLPDPLIMLDRSRQVVRLNHAAQMQFGRDLKGRDLASAVRHPALLEGVDDVLEDARGRIVDFSMPGTLDRYYNARIAGLPQDAPDGTAVILSLHDMTGVRRAERLRADFVANASHELRTPLSSLVGFVETLSGPAKDDEEARERFLTIMHDQASRMSRLIEDLLSLSRIEMAEHAAPTGTVELGEVLEGVVGGLELYAQEKDMTIDVESARLPALIG